MSDTLFPGGRPMCGTCHERPVYLAGQCGPCYAGQPVDDEHIGMEPEPERPDRDEQEMDALNTSERVRPVRGHGINE